MLIITSCVWGGGKFCEITDERCRSPSWAAGQTCPRVIPGQRWWIRRLACSCGRPDFGIIAKRLRRNLVPRGLRIFHPRRGAGAQRAKKVELLSHASVNGSYRFIEAIHAGTERIYYSASLADGPDILAPMGELTLLGPRRRRRGATACCGCQGTQVPHKEQREGEQSLANKNKKGC